MSSLSAPWSVSTLLDFEYALIRDNVPDPLRRWRRDREIFTSFTAHSRACTHDNRRAAFNYWLQAVRMQRMPLPGHAIVEAWRIVATMAIVASLLLGLSYAGGLLKLLDDDGHVSATRVFILTVGLQVLLLAVVLLVFTHRRLTASRSEHGSLRLWMVSRVLARFGSRLRGPLATLAVLETRYRSLLLSKVMAVGQICVAAFNCGIVVALSFYHFTVTDVRFGWSATHDFTPAHVSRAVDGVATPWSWMLPMALPTLEDVSQSRLTRDANDLLVAPDVSRRWGAFLVASLVVYGVLLRLLLVGLLNWSARRKMKDVRFEGASADLLWKRMTTDPPTEAGEPLPPIDPPEPHPWWPPWPFRKKERTPA